MAKHQLAVESSSAPAIVVDHVSKSFRLPHEKLASVKSVLLNVFRRGRSFEQQHVLKDISFEIKQGEFFGILGRNGSGKSTLLKLLAGIYALDKGRIDVKGSLTPFIELGVGFNPELTGRENVFLNGALLGFNRKEMRVMYDGIVQFAELERFMDQKLKNYSSGMQVRLAFSIAIRANSDILLIDEVLAVGDAAFQRKCFDHFMMLKKNKRTVILVTHDMAAVRQYCDRAIMIDNGQIVRSGKPEEVAQAYQKLFIEEAEANAEEGSGGVKMSGGTRWGEGGLRAQKAKAVVTPQKVSLTVSYRCEKDLPSAILGFTVYSPMGINILEGNTQRSRHKIPDLRAGQVVTMTWEMPNIFANGTYDVSVACCDQSATHFYDWWNEATSFKIRKEEPTAGTVDPVLSITQLAVK